MHLSLTGKKFLGSGRFLLKSRDKPLNLSGFISDSTKSPIESRVLFLSNFSRVFTLDPKLFYSSVPHFCTPLILPFIFLLFICHLPLSSFFASAIFYYSHFSPLLVFFRSSSSSLSYSPFPKPYCPSLPLIPYFLLISAVALFPPLVSCFSYLTENETTFWPENL